MSVGPVTSGKMDYKHICLLHVLVLTQSWQIYSVEYNVDMESSQVCTSVTPILVGPYDVYNVYAEPRQDGRGVRDKCTVRFFSSTNQKFKIFVRDLIFRECQIYVKLYDGDRYLSTPRYTFSCDSPTGNLIYSFNTDIALSLEKPDATSTGYKFYYKVALDTGPFIGGEDGSEEGDGLSTGLVVGIVLGVVLVLIIIVAVILYAVFVYRRKKEEKELALTRSRSTLFGPTASLRDGDSIHSSKHSLHSTHSTHSTHFTKDTTSKYNYPAFRTSISDKAPKCNSIDTKSYDSDAVDEANYQRKPILGKDVRNEFVSMKKGLEKEERRQQREKDDLRMQERRWNETRMADKRSREESNHGFGRSNRTRDNRLVLNEENLRRSSRADRHRGRSYNDEDDRFQRSSRAGSSRSTRTRERSRGHSPARSAGVHSEPDYVSKHRQSSLDRGKERSHGGSRTRSHSSGTQSRRKRDYYEERDAYSDYDYDNSSKDKYNSYRSSRSGTHRSRSHSSNRHHR